MVRPLSQDTPEPPPNPGQFRTAHGARFRIQKMEPMSKQRFFAFHIFVTRPLSAVKSIGLATKLATENRGLICLARVASLAGLRQPDIDLVRSRVTGGNRVHWRVLPGW